MLDRRGAEAAGWISVAVGLFMSLILAAVSLLVPGVPTLIRALLLIAAFLQGTVLVYKIASPRKTCPNCGADLPKWRIPTDRYEAAIGGWTCPNCGTKLTWRLKVRN